MSTWLVGLYIICRLNRWKSSALSLVFILILVIVFFIVPAQHVQQIMQSITAQQFAQSVLMWREER